MNVSRLTILIVSIVLGASYGAEAFGQQPTSPTSISQSRRSVRGGRMTVRQKFDPRFRIEPLVQKLSGRMGDVLTFSFEATSKERPTRIEVIPVALKQLSNGQISFDETLETSDQIQLVSPNRMTLSAGQTVPVEGLIQIPARDAASNGLFGILVRDLGENDLAPTNRNVGAGAQVKFVTQYLVRLEVDVENARTENARRLVLSDVQVESRDGRPHLRARLSNPTGTPFILSASARFYSRYTRERMRPFGLTMPCRANSEGADRYEIMILPHSEIDLVEFVPSAVTSGRYQIDLDLNRGDSTVKHEVIDLVIDANTYPAQTVMIAELDNRLTISPAQIELSQIRGGNRRISLNLRNPTDRAAKIQLNVIPGVDIPGVDQTVAPDASVDQAGDANRPPGAFDANAKDIIVQPSTLTLSPGRSRKVSVTLRSAKSTEPVQLATLDVQTRLDGRPETIKRRLPIAIVRGTGAIASAELSQIRFSDGDDSPRFLVDVANLGNRHLPLIARLVITGQSGTRQEIQGGFSQWLLPGETSAIEFPLPESLAPDTYELRCEVQVAGEVESIRQIIEVGSESEQSAARPASFR